MAAGVVSAVAALVLEANRTTIEPDGTPMAPMNPYAVKAVLQYTATPLADADPLAQGAGEINAAGAVALIRAFDTRTSPWTVSTVATSTLFGTESSAWSRALVVGQLQLQNLTPDAAVSGANIIWGSNVIWGTNIVWDTNIVWGLQHRLGFEAWRWATRRLPRRHRAGSRHASDGDHATMVARHGLAVAPVSRRGRRQEKAVWSAGSSAYRQAAFITR
jgi:hypothetical protein